MNERVRERLRQAREALEEARSLREAGMDLGFLLNQLYLAYYYPVIALVHDGRVPDTMQSVTIGLFEQRFVKEGPVVREHLEGLKRLFELKPKCGGGCTIVPDDEVDRLMESAGSFIALVERILA